MQRSAFKNIYNLNIMLWERERESWGREKKPLNIQTPQQHKSITAKTKIGTQKRGKHRGLKDEKKPKHMNIACKALQNKWQQQLMLWLSFFLVLISNQTFKYIVIKILITALGEKDTSFCNTVYFLLMIHNFVLFLECQCPCELH